MLEAALLAEEFATRPIDERLLADFHARICGDLTPDWAAKNGPNAWQRPLGCQPAPQFTQSLTSTATEWSPYER